MTRLAGKMLNGSSTKEDEREYRYLQEKRTKDLVKLPKIPVSKRKQKWLDNEA